MVLLVNTLDGLSLKILKMTEVKSTKKWYVIRSVSGKENKIKEYIESEIIRLNLQNHIEQILVPTEKVIKIRNGKK